MADDLDDEELEIDEEELVEDDDDLELDDGGDDADALTEGENDEVALAEGKEPEARAPRARKGRSGDETGDEDDDDVVDLEEEHHPDDVEDPLDVLLKERTTAERLDEDEAEVEEDELEPDERTNGSGRVVPRGADEFLCTQCFLVKPLNQRDRPGVDVCKDCA